MHKLWNQRRWHPAESVVPMQLRQSLVGVWLGKYPVIVKIEIRSDCVSVKEVESQNLGKHHFCVINEVRDAGIKDILNKIYHADFNESVQPKKFDKMLNISDQLLWEDQKFLKLTEKKVKVELPLSATTFI